MLDTETLLACLKVLEHEVDELRHAEFMSSGETAKDRIRLRRWGVNSSLAAIHTLLVKATAEQFDLSKIVEVANQEEAYKNTGRGGEYLCSIPIEDDNA